MPEGATAVPLNKATGPLPISPLTWKPPAPGAALRCIPPPLRTVGSHALCTWMLINDISSQSTWNQVTCACLGPTWGPL